MPPARTVLCSSEAFGRAEGAALEPTVKGMPVKKPTTKNLKLKLHRETLCALEASELDTVVGAATNVRTVCGTCHTCFVIHTLCVP